MKSHSGDKGAGVYQSTPADHFFYVPGAILVRTDARPGESLTFVTCKRCGESPLAELCDHAKATLKAIRDGSLR